MTVSIAWRDDFTSSEANVLHAAAFGHRVYDDSDWDWRGLVERHSLGWVIAREDEALVGFLNVVWDGSEHAWLQDVIVDPRCQGRGIGTQLVAEATASARRCRVRVAARRLRVRPASGSISAPVASSLQKPGCCTCGASGHAHSSSPGRGAPRLGGQRPRVDRLLSPPVLALPHVASGKVREIYSIDPDHLLFVATDRISAYDVILEPDHSRQGPGADGPVVVLLPMPSMTLRITL